MTDDERDIAQEILASQGLDGLEVDLCEERLFEEWLRKLGVVIEATASTREK